MKAFDETIFLLICLFGEVWGDREEEKDVREKLEEA